MSPAELPTGAATPSVAVLVDPNQPELPYRVAAAAAAAVATVDGFLVWVGPANPNYDPPPAPALRASELFGFRGPVVSTCPRTLTAAAEIVPHARRIHYCWDPGDAAAAAAAGATPVFRTPRHARAAGRPAARACERPARTLFREVAGEPD
jgi:hypothetical protein